MCREMYIKYVILKGAGMVAVGETRVARGGVGRKQVGRSVFDNLNYIIMIIFRSEVLYVIIGLLS